MIVSNSEQWEILYGLTTNGDNYDNKELESMGIYSWTLFLSHIRYKAHLDLKENEYNGLYDYYVINPYDKKTKSCKRFKKTE